MVGYCRINEVVRGAGVGLPKLYVRFTGEVVSPWVSVEDLEMLEWRRGCGDEGGLKREMIEGLAAGFNQHSSQNYYAMKAFTMYKSNGWDSNSKSQ